jgi:hypothetical protein
MMDELEVKKCRACGNPFIGTEGDHLCPKCRSYPRKVQWLAVTTLIFFMVMPVNADEANFDTALFYKLSEMMKVEPPDTITVELASPLALLQWYKTQIFQRCMHGLVFDPFGLSVVSCNKQRETFVGIVYGRWIHDPDNPYHLHVEWLRHVSVETKVHEFMHWYLYNSTIPKGVVNSEEITEAMTGHVLVSEEFLGWLEKQEPQEEHEAQ